MSAATSVFRRLAMPAAVALAMLLLMSFHQVVTAAAKDGVEKRQAFLLKRPVSPCHGISDIESLEACLSGQEPQQLARR